MGRNLIDREDAVVILPQGKTGRNPIGREDAVVTLPQAKTGRNLIDHEDIAMIRNQVESGEEKTGVIKDDAQEVLEKLHPDFWLLIQLNSFKVKNMWQYHL